MILVQFKTHDFLMFLGAAGILCLVLIALGADE